MGELCRERTQWGWFYSVLLPQMAAFDLSTFVKTKDALVFYLVLLSIHQACGSTSKGSLIITPYRKLKIDGRQNYFIGNVTITCDGSGNTNDLNDLFLAKTKDQSEEDVEEILQNRKPTDKKEADLEFFSGSISSKKLSYTMVNPTCAKNGVTFKCTVQAKGDAAAFEEEANLELTVGDQEVHMTPASVQDALRTVADRIVITCSAIMGSVVSIDEARVVWQWEELSEGQTHYRPISDVAMERVSNLKLTAVPCQGVNSTSIFSLTIQPSDSNRKYRCSYMNPASENAVFDLTNAKTFSVGNVKLLDYGTEEPRQTIYTQSSLIGMILGVFSFFMISCMGLLYVYRKNRGGKKYDIESALLQEEENKLTEMEQKLKMPKAVAAAAAAAAGAATATDEPAAATEEGSVAASEDHSNVSNAVDDTSTATGDEDMSTAVSEETSNA